MYSNHMYYIDYASYVVINIINNKYHIESKINIIFLVEILYSEHKYICSMHKGQRLKNKLHKSISY